MGELRFGDWQLDEWPELPLESHVHPLDDLKPHALHGTQCWCAPQVERDGETTLVIHRAMDGREDFENGRRRVS